MLIAYDLIVLGGNLTGHRYQEMFFQPVLVLLVHSCLASSQPVPKSLLLNMHLLGEHGRQDAFIQEGFLNNTRGYLCRQVTVYIVRGGFAFLLLTSMFIFILNEQCRLINMSS